MNSIYRFRCTVDRKSQSSDVLVLFSATKPVEPESLATTIEEEIEVNLVPDEVLIVVREPGFDEAFQTLTSGPLNTSTFARLGERSSITLVGYDQRGKESRRKRIGGPTPRIKIVFSDFCRRAVTNIFKERHGFVESTTTYHFENPSGRHTERFIRLSNILVRGAEIAFIGFCTLPFIPDICSVAYIDTPSLYAVIAAINEQLASFPGVCHPILADNFSSYGGLTNYRFERRAEAFILISASSSGTLGERLITDHGFDPRSVIHLLFLGRNTLETPIVCDLKLHPKLNPSGIDSLPSVERATTCHMCATGSLPIKLQGDQFDIAGPQPGSLTINKDYAPPSLASLMDRNAGKGIFAVGLEKTAGKQPSLFHVDEQSLLNSEDFLNRLDFTLRRSLPVSVSHVIYINERSLDLSKHVAQFASTESHVVSTVSAKSLKEIPGGTLSSIVIVATVIESGRSLLDVSRDLRSIAPGAPLLYLVGMSKSTGEDRRESLSKTLVKTNLAFPHQVVEIEKIILPPSSIDNPWDIERNLLQNLSVRKLATAKMKSYIDERIDTLRKIPLPLTNNLFLGNASDRTLSLQPGFVFWPADLCTRVHSQADVFFTISSVLQQLRANAEKGQKAAIKTSWFQQTILASVNFGRFNDDVIQASFLRAAFPYELNYTNSPTDSHEIARLIRRIIESAETPRGGAAAEFLLAIATGRLRLCKSDVRDVLSAKSTHSPVVEFLKKACAAMKVAK